MLSSAGLPISCTPMGSPPALSASGNAMAGRTRNVEGRHIDVVLAQCRTHCRPRCPATCHRSPRDVCLAAASEAIPHRNARSSSRCRAMRFRTVSISSEYCIALVARPFSMLVHVTLVNSSCFDFSPDVRDEGVEACGGLNRDDGRVSAPGRMKIIVEFELFNRMAESLAKPGGCSQRTPRLRRRSCLRGRCALKKPDPADFRPPALTSLR